MPNVIEPPGTRSSLLIRLRDSDDHNAWSQFVDLYGPLVFAYCRRRGLQDCDAADIMQDVLLQVSRSICSLDYDPNRGRFRGWLTTILRSKLSAFWTTRRRHANEQTHTFDDIAGEQDGDWLEACRQWVMELALRELREELSDDHWNAFEAVWLNDRPATSAASDCGRNVAWVYLVKSRALASLRRIVDRISEDVPWCDAGDSLWNAE